MVKSLNNKKILLVDSDDSFIELIKIDLNLIGIVDITVAQSYDKGIEKIEEQFFDIYLLDVDLDSAKSRKGIELAFFIKKRYPKVPIIFLSSLYSESIYQEAKKVFPHSFLPKKLSRLNLLQAIECALQVIPRDQASSGSNPKLNLIEKKDQILFKVGGIHKVVSSEDIIYFFSKDKSVFGKIGNRSYPLETTLKSLEQKFHPSLLRIHKKYLVNQKFIKLINYKDDIIIMENRERLPIGYTYRKSFLESLNIIS